MCDVCSSLYHSDSKHDISACPVRAALYCSCCQVYGHSTFKCPDKATWQTRKPEYIEQLISPMLRAHHKITTQTPIQDPNGAPMSCPYVPVLEIPEDKDGKFIRATLASYNLPSSGIKENRRVIEAYCANVLGKKVVYIQNGKDLAEKQAKSDKKKNTIKIKKVATCS